MHLRLMQNIVEYKLTGGRGIHKNFNLLNSTWKKKKEKYYKWLEDVYV